MEIDYLKTKIHAVHGNMKEIIYKRKRALKLDIKKIQQLSCLNSKSIIYIL